MARIYTQNLSINSRNPLKLNIFDLISKTNLLALVRRYCLIIWFCEKCSSLVETNMVYTRREKQQNRRLLNQLDDFDHDVIIAYAVNNVRQNVVVTNGLADRWFAVNDNRNGSSAVANETAVDVQTLEKNFTDRVTKKWVKSLKRSKIKSRTLFWQQWIILSHIRLSYESG